MSEEKKETYAEKLEERREKRSYVGVRHPTLIPDNDRFISPARDIAYISRPLIMGALEICGELYPEKIAGMNEFARAMAVYYSRMINDKNHRISQIMADLRAELDKVPDDARKVCTEELLFAYMVEYGLGVRESTSTKRQSDEDIREAVKQAGLLSKLPEELRKTVEDSLSRKGQYATELERPAQQGTIKEPDAETKT